MFCFLLFMITFFLAPVTNIWLVILITSCVSTLIGSGFITLWFCSNVYAYKFISFICFIISLVLSSFQLGREFPLSTERLVLMILNIIGIVAGLAFLVEKQKRHQEEMEIEICKVNVKTGKRLDTL